MILYCSLFHKHNTRISEHQNTLQVSGIQQSGDELDDAD